MPTIGALGLALALAGQAPTGRDLEAVRAAGTLRVLVHGPTADAVPRAGTAAALDRAALAALGERLGVEVSIVAVPEASSLVPRLVAGDGDLIGDALPVDGKAGVAFAAPLRAVDIALAGPPGDRRVGRPDGVRGRSLWLRRSFAASAPVARALTALGAKAVDPAPETLDAQEILSRLEGGESAVTLVRSDELGDFRGSGGQVAVGATVAAGLPVAWSVRPESPRLLEAVNAFVYEQALTGHRREAYAVDLPDIRRRRVLRVAMLNNPASYFIFRGQEVGFQYDLAALLAARLGVRLEIVVPDRPNEVWQLLADGRADVVPATLTPGTEVPPSAVVSPPLDYADQVIVQPAAEPPLARVEDLAGRVLYVRRSSAYTPALELVRARVPGLTVVPASETLETEELIDKVGRGQIPLTVANSALLAMELTYRDDVKGSLVIAAHQPLVWAVRADAPALARWVAAFATRETGGREYAEIHDRYFSNRRRMSEVLAGEVTASGRISPYDELARRHGARYGIDWRLVVAQMYQESRFDPSARSWMGALGLLQVMPVTGRELGARNLLDPEENVKAGVRYLSQLIGALDPAMPLQQRVRFALAGYNAGFGHVIDARTLARRRGLDPDRWFHNVETAMLLLEKPEFYRRARSGYVRGREPVDYVSRIQTKYDAYCAVVPASPAREARSAGER